MTDLFICYSRKDTEFVHRLIDELQYRGIETWDYGEDIPQTPHWWSAILQGIEEADTFVCIITPAWLVTPIAHAETNFAISLNKRLIPVILGDLYEPEKSFGELSTMDFPKNVGAGNDLIIVARQNWRYIAAHNWIPFRDTDDFDSFSTNLIQVINTDLEHVRRHTHYLNSARKWDAQGRKPDYLLRGEELREAGIWLSEAGNKDPQPLDLHRQFIQESQQEEAKYSQVLQRAYHTALSRVFGFGPRKIFISYRRVDSGDVCGRIYDRLEPAFGRKNLFLDVDSIDYGSDFSQFIQRTLTECFAVLVVVGPQWVTTLKERAAKPEADFVKIEIASALKRQHLNVIPLFVGGAPAPDAKALPNELQALPLKNGTAIRSGRDFHRDMDTLIKELKKLRSRATKDTSA